MSQPAHTQTDLTIIGGGLAGLTLALQVARARPETSIAVVERQKHPLPEAVVKVGESTVEIGSYYLSDVLELKDHLDKAQLPKFGLRCFFGEFGDDLSRADEIGASKLLSVPTYQIDRGVLENFLAEEVQRHGVRFIDGSRVKGLRLDPAEGHEVTITDGEAEQTLASRWVVDAAGRASLIKHKLNLGEKNDHPGGAIWFRVNKRVNVDEWSEKREWHDRCMGTDRWLSTNHLMGPGYWVWIIPLPGDITSIGIVADASMHDLKSMSSFEGSMQWLRQNQPRCAEALEGVEPMDFKLLKKYSHNCKQVFSADRWCLTGEAGVFGDPFYSPGSDFIGISNGFISDLVVRELNGESVDIRVGFYEKLYQSFFSTTMEIYTDVYAGFGDSQLMAMKTVWDYAYYWGILSPLYFNNAMTDISLMARMSPDLLEIREVAMNMQKVFRKRAAEARVLEPKGFFVDPLKIHVLRRFNIELDETVEGDALAERIKQNSMDLADLAERLRVILEEDMSEADEVERNLLGDLRERVAA